MIATRRFSLELMPVGERPADLLPAFIRIIRNPKLFPIAYPL